MKTYPSIIGSSKAPHKDCYVFLKYDGSNMRAEWSAKRGWYKFGTRTQMIDSSDPIYGKGINLFLEKYGDELSKTFSKEKSFRGVSNFIVFFEFFGSKSFAGIHYPDDNHDVVLFDVNPIKKGILGPKEFLDTFSHLNVAECIGNYSVGQELISNVQQEILDLESKYAIKNEIPEGVICKGGSGHNLWMCKIKTLRYKEKLKEVYRQDWEKYWE